MGVNLKHQFFAAQIARRSMREIGGGSIVNFSSTAWMMGMARLSAYAAAKAGVIGLTNSLAREFGPDNIRVNAIAPGATMSDRVRNMMTSDKAIAAMERQHLLGLGQPEDVAHVALFLASDEARIVTGVIVPADSGWTAA